MSDVRSRPSAPRGRGSGRGGRGGYSSRGRGGTSQSNVDTPNEPSIAEAEGEMGQFKQQYGSMLSTMKEMFPNWTDEDLVYALQETNGNLELTIDRISEGTLQN